MSTSYTLNLQFTTPNRYGLGTKRIKGWKFVVDTNTIHHDTAYSESTPVNLDFEVDLESGRTGYQVEIYSKTSSGDILMESIALPVTPPEPYNDFTIHPQDVVKTIQPGTYVTKESDKVYHCANIWKLKCENTVGAIYSNWLNSACGIGSTLYCKSPLTYCIKIIGGDSKPPDYRSINTDSFVILPPIDERLDYYDLIKNRYSIQMAWKNRTLFYSTLNGGKRAAKDNDYRYLAVTIAGSDCTPTLSLGRRPPEGEIVSIARYGAYTPSGTTGYTAGFTSESTCGDKDETNSIDGATTYVIYDLK